MRTFNSLTRPTVLVSFLMLLVAVSLLVLSQDFGRSSGMFPRFVGAIFVALTTADLILQLRKWYTQTLPEASELATIIKQLVAIGWLIGLVSSLFVFGFLITLPLFIFVFLTWRSKQHWRRAFAISSGALFFVLVIFVWLLDYELYSGWLLSAF